MKYIVLKSILYSFRLYSGIIFCIITFIFSTFRPLGHKFLYALYRSTANTTKFKNKNLWPLCVSPMYIVWESFLFLVLTLLVIIIAQQWLKSIHLGHLWKQFMRQYLLKFILLLIYKLWHFSYGIFTFSSRFVLSFTSFSVIPSMIHRQICNIRTYKLVQSVYFKFLYFHKTLSQINIYI